MHHFCPRMSQDRASRQPILFFDGECTLCNRSILWILRHERNDDLVFASLSSKTARDMLNGTPLANHTDSMVLREADGSLFHASDAALRLVRHLTPAWQLLLVLTVLPRFVREPAYRLVARNRKRWFGTKAHCALLSGVDPKRLLS